MYGELYRICKNTKKERQKLNKQKVVFVCKNRPELASDLSGVIYIGEKRDKNKTSVKIMAAKGVAK